MRQKEISLNAEKNISAFYRFVHDEFLRARHAYLIGRTGVGKSTELERVVVADINAGLPGMFVDPHGESALRVLDTIERTRKICYADFSDPEYALRWNPVAGTPKDRAAKQANDIIAALKDIFFVRDFNAPRFTHYLRHHLIPLLERGDGTFLDLLRMLSDKDFREEIVYDVEDPLSKDFWRPKGNGDPGGEYAQADKKYNREAVAPIANKLSQILSNPLVRNVLESRQPVLNLKDAFADGFFVVVNLAKGKVDDDSASFVGSLLVSEAHNALMERTPSEYKPTSLTFDEFQNYAPYVLASTLAEIRKKGGWLTLAHQFASQLDEELFDAIQGNCGTIISFQVSPKDATLLAPQFDTRPQESFNPKALTNLEPYHAYMRTTDWELIETEPPPPTNGRRNVVIAASRERFSRQV